MSKDGRSLDKLEKQIPERVSYALRSAYKSAINSGHFVVIARNGKIVKIGPDLKEQVVGHVPKPMKVRKACASNLDKRENAPTSNDR
jgi:hypothetical protein